MPPDIRKGAAQNRKEYEAELKYRQRAAEEKERERSREEREKFSPEEMADFMVAGVHYEGRDAVIEQFVNEGDRVFLARDPHNRFSRHAVEVRLGNGLQIGFVPEEDACRLAPYLDQGCPHWACVKKILDGGSVPIPVVLAYIYPPTAVVDGVVFPHQVPPKTYFGNQRKVPVRAKGHAESNKTGCLSTTTCLIVLMLTYYFLRMTW